MRQAREAGRALAGAVLVLMAGAAGAQPAGTTFRDCPECPEMVVVPAGTFLMDGSSGYVVGHSVYRMTIRDPFAVGVYEVTRGEFARFVSATGRSMGDTCHTYEDELKQRSGRWTYEAGLQERSGRHWRNPGFSQTDEHPVVCVSWEDAKAYVEWLSRGTGKGYRLMSDVEWEYVARGGTEKSWSWRYRWEKPGRCRYVQYVNWADGVVDCYESYGLGVRWTEPVGSDSANGFGLYDMHRNVMEWRDCYGGGSWTSLIDMHRNVMERRDCYGGGSWTSLIDTHRTVMECMDCRRPHGGSWRSVPRGLLGAYRGGFLTRDRNSNVGFRVARTLTP